MPSKDIKIKPYNENVWLIIDKIKKHIPLRSDNECHFSYGLEKKGFPSWDIQKTIIDKLGKDGYIKIKPAYKLVGIQTYSIKRTPKFEKLLEEYKKHFEQDDIFLIRKNSSIFIKIGKQKWFISEQNYKSENDLVFDYIFSRKADGEVSKLSIENQNKKTIKKSFHQIIKDGGFVRVIKSLFFPKISMDFLLIRRHIPASRYKELGINIKSVINWLNKNNKPV